jgi:hypothetical protein
VISRARGLRTPCTTSVSAGSRSDLCAKQSSRPRALGTACAESRSVVHHPLLSAAEGASLLARTTAQSGLITALVSGVLQPGAAPPTCAPRRPTGVTLPLGAAPRAAQRQRGPAATLAAAVSQQRSPAVARRSCSVSAMDISSGRMHYLPFCSGEDITRRTLVLIGGREKQRSVAHRRLNELSATNVLMGYRMTGMRGPCLRYMWLFSRPNRGR